MKLIAILLLCLPLPLHAAEFPVDSADALTDAMKHAKPGDVVVFTDGDYRDQALDFAGRGTPDAPITLRSQTPGGVTFMGNSTLSISGEHLVADGFVFRNGQPLDLSVVVQFRGTLGNANDCRLTNTVIENYNPPDAATRYMWIGMYGRRNRVDHCLTRGQTHSGVTLCVWLDADGPAEHSIDHNHFADRPPAPDDANGFETIRVGDSRTSDVDARVVVEHNLFDNLDGEIEIVSNKSCGNTYRGNTFRNSAGTLTLRHGHRCVVEGNFFLGDHKPGSGGVRVMGEDHRITHNTFADLDDRMDGAISFAAGIRNTAPSGYQQVQRATLAHNTVVNAKGAAIKTDWGRGQRNRELLPIDVSVIRNVFVTTADPFLEGEEGEGWTWESNLAFGPASAEVAHEGVQWMNPGLVQRDDGLWLVTRALAGWPTTDAHSAASPTYRPVSASDVGPAWRHARP